MINYLYKYHNEYIVTTGLISLSSIILWQIYRLIKWVRSLIKFLKYKRLNKILNHNHYWKQNGKLPYCPKCDIDILRDFQLRFKK